MNAATRAVWGGQPPKPAGLQVIDFRPMVKNTLRGFASVQFGSGLRILDCPVHVHTNGRAWVGLPAKPITDEAGQVRRDERGKIAAANR
jgi:hypothetical protein